MCVRGGAAFSGGKNRNTVNLMYTDLNFIEVTDTVIYFAAPHLEMKRDASIRCFYMPGRGLEDDLTGGRESDKIKTENKHQTLFEQSSCQPFDLHMRLCVWLLGGGFLRMEIASHFSL